LFTLNPAKSIVEIARKRFFPEMKARKKPARLEKIELRGFKARQEITKAKAPMIAAIREILEANHAYWPLSVRQVHYRLLPYRVLTHASKPNSVYRNTLNDYHKLTELLARARLAGLIPLKRSAMKPDRSRSGRFIRRSRVLSDENSIVFSSATGAICFRASRSISK
jgi:hypothetical protein